MKTLYLMQGVPGSGKSTVAHIIWERSALQGLTDDVTICSTDDLWYNPEGVYAWDRALIGEKHAENQRLAEDAMRAGIKNVVIDNTNITRRDAKPYMDLAFAYGYQVQVVRVSCSVETAIERQKDRPLDRQVPVEVIERMAVKMEDLL